jgi:hypothetical protein
MFPIRPRPTCMMPAFTTMSSTAALTVMRCIRKRKLLSAQQTMWTAIISLSQAKPWLC